MDDCHEVLREFLFGGEYVYVKNDETCPCLLYDPFDKFCPEPCQSIFVGHHNFFDHSCLDSFQKPLEAFPFVVESRCDVCEDGIVRIRFLHGSDLSLEIVLLLCRRYSTVDCTTAFAFLFIGLVVEVLSGPPTLTVCNLGFQNKQGKQVQQVQQGKQVQTSDQRSQNRYDRYWPSS